MSSGGNLSCVLVAVDGSEESMNALRWALNNLKLTRFHRCSLLHHLPRPIPALHRSPAPDSTDAPSFTVFHVQSPPSIATGLNPGAIPFGGPSDLEVPAFTAAIEAHQKRITNAVLDHALGICSEFNLTSKVRTHVLVGDPKEKICEAVQDLNADVLVMGSRAFGPIKRMFLGSVSNYCAHHSPCPVIIIKEKDIVNKRN
ncbi:Universal stress protein A-like protein [Glycine soja]|uniref:Universal stress protein A-like protein n=1 Tax=Glycine soja TaxID=3848 RepID=A0A0B2QYH0_GLYSO|nr:Universal stress protein A-like protein [Glycine soja]